MKKYMCIIIVLVLVAVLSSSVNAVCNEKVTLSTLSDEECIAFLEESGVVIPSLFEDKMYWALFVRTTIERVEENPDVEFLYGYSVLSRFANDIKTAVNEYYGTASVSTAEYIESDEDILLDSTVYGEWTNDYKSYNCYAYVINDDESRDPGVFHWMSLGNDASKYSYNCYANMATILSWIEDDFEYLGLNINSVTTTYTEMNPRYHTNLICVRKDADGIPWYYDADGVLHYFHDYHFMKLGTDGSWYHKPGKTNPLKYNYVPNVDRPWLSEGYNGETGKYSREDSLTYDSEIYFIKYTTPCEWIYEQHSTGMHVKRCTICGTARVLDCEWSDYVYTGENTHQANCVHCGVVSTADVCTREYVHSYDDTLGDVHEEICTVCNHVYTAQENCEFVYTDNEDGTHVAQCADCDVQYVLDCDYVCSYSGDGSTHTHTTTCSGCDHSETESCTFAIRYNGYVDGHNTHINACTECGYSPSGAVQCTYNSSGKCRFCGTFENYVPINREKEELLEA